MKRLLSLLVLAACVTLAGCEVHVHHPWPRFELGARSVTVSPTVGSYAVDIYGGSGDFLAEINNADVADVHVEGLFGANGHALIIEPKKEGTARITVIDRKTAAFEFCSLTVTLDARRVAFRFNDIATHVDADAPEAIEADLAADTRWAKGGGVDFVGSYNDVYPPGEYRLDILFVGADNRDVATGTLGLGETGVEWNPAFDFMPLGAPLLEGPIRFKFERAGDSWSADYYVVEGVHTRVNIQPVRAYHRRFYEDLTEHYKAKYPDAGVRSVARVVFSNVE